MATSSSFRVRKRTKQPAPKRNRVKWRLRISGGRKPTPEHVQFWRIIDGAVKSTLDAHPEYVPSAENAKQIRLSITKRVTGALMSYAGVRYAVARMEPDGDNAGG